MAMFGTKKAKPSEGSELVLAYLEEAQRVRTPVTVIDARGREVSATLAAVTEDRVSLATQSPLSAEKGADISLVFIQDGLRLRAPARILDIKPGSLTVDLPSTLALAERRRKPRARLNAREGATATALTGLFDGVGLNGAIENISETGLCIRVDRAMDVKTQRKMHMGANLLPVGQPLMLVKLSKLPKCPPIELAGTVAWLDASQGLLVGIAFEPGKEPLLAPIRSLVSSRAGAIPVSVPPKSRRQPESARDTEEAPAPPRKESGSPVLPEASAPPDIGFQTAPASLKALLPEPLLEQEPAPMDERSLALMRVKKRTRGLLLAMPEGPDREALAAFLSEDGYGRVLCADTLTDLLEQVERPGIHLILVDGGVAEIQGLALASLLRHRLGEEMPPVILAETSVDADLVLGAQQTGVARILVKPYDQDQDFLRLIEDHLGIG